MGRLSNPGAAYPAPLVDLEQIIETVGTIGILLIVFAESGLFFGFFLPGDSLLVTAGVLASQGELPALPLLIGCPIAAIAGDQVGYVFGRRVGPALFRRPESRLFKPKHVDRARAYFDAHGSKTIVIARFVPIVRTFAPIVAGVANMPYRTFVVFNVVGGILWGFGVTLAGYLLGHVIEDYIYPAIAVVILVSLVPVAVEFMRARREHAATKLDPPA